MTPLNEHFSIRLRTKIEQVYIISDFPELISIFLQQNTLIEIKHRTKAN